MDNKNIKYTCDTYTNWKWNISNNLKGNGIIIREDVNGIGVVTWIKIINIERKETEKRTTTINCNSVWEKEVKKNNYRNSNNKMGSAGNRECFWK